MNKMLTSFFEPFVKDFFPGWFILCSLTWSLMSKQVLGFIDLRGHSCETDAMEDALKDLKQNWTSTISVRVECTGQYDYALDVAHLDSYRCNVQERKWTPDYIPDCNFLIHPDNISMSLVVNMKTDCRSARIVSVHSKIKIVFASGKSVDFSKICELLNMLTPCLVEDAAMICDAKSLEQTAISDLLPKDQLAINSGAFPFLYLKLTAEFSNELESELIERQARKLRAAVAQELDLPEDSAIDCIVDAGCHNGSVYVLDSKRGMTCRGCSKGHYLSREKRKCLRCPPGYYGDQAMSELCSVCAGNNGSGNVSTEDRLVTAAGCTGRAFEQQRSILTKAEDVMSDASMATIIVGISLVMLVSAAILSVIAQATVYRKTKADGLKSQPPSPTDACFADSSSRTSLDTSQRKPTLLGDRKISSVLALTHGIDDGAGMPLNLTWEST